MVSERGEREARQVSMESWGPLAEGSGSSQHALRCLCIISLGSTVPFAVFLSRQNSWALALKISPHPLVPVPSSDGCPSDPLECTENLWEKPVPFPPRSAGSPHLSCITFYPQVPQAGLCGGQKLCPLSFRQHLPCLASLELAIVLLQPSK